MMVSVRRVRSANNAVQLNLCRICKCVIGSSYANDDLFIAYRVSTTRVCSRFRDTRLYAQARIFRDGNYLLLWSETV